MPLNINGTTGISGVDGSVSAPAITGTDSNTGITFPSADTIKFSTGGVERMVITNNGLSSTGHVLQVVQGMKTSRQSFSGANNFQDMGLGCNLTPSSASNKVLVMINISATTNLNTPGFFTLCRGGSDINASDTTTFSQLAIGDAEGSRTRCSTQVHHIDNDNDIQNVNVFFLDSPNSTSAVYYEAFLRTDGSGIIYINGTKGNADNVGHGRTASTIIAMEIAG